MNQGSTNPQDPAGWVQEHGSYLFAQALRALGERNEAEDFVQETLLQGLRRLATYQGRGNIRGWLSSILRNQIIDHFRRKGRRPVQVEFDGLPEIAEPPGDESESSQEALEAVRHSLASLPEQDQRLFLLSEANGYKHQELAEVFNLTPVNVRVKLHRIRHRLKTELMAQGIQPLL